MHRIWVRSSLVPIPGRLISRYYSSATVAEHSAIPSVHTSLPVPMIPSPGRSHWKTTCPVSLTRDNFINLLYGKTPLIEASGFLKPEECWEYEKAFSHKIQPYTHNTGPLLQKVGIAQVCSRSRHKYVTVVLGDVTLANLLTFSLNTRPNRQMT